MKNFIETVKKHKKLVAVIIILLLLLITTTITWAFWKKTKKQTGNNELIAACIDISFGNVGENKGVSLLNEFPITDEDAMTNYEGYDFYVQNNCPEAVTFFIASEKLTPDNESIQDSSVSMALIDEDEKTLVISNYASLTNTDPVSDDSHKAKILKYETLEGNEKKEYNFKVWINETSPNEDIGKAFNTRLFITTYHGMVDPEIAVYEEGCLRINGLGTVIGYMVDADDLNGNPCATDNGDGTYTATSLVLPATISGTPLKKVNERSFVPRIKEDENQKIYIIQVYTLENDGGEIYVVKNKDENFYDEYAKIMGYASLEDAAEDSDITVEEFIAEIDAELSESYNGPYESMEEYTLDQMGEGGEKTVSFTSVDLSHATNLEIIDDYTFKTYQGNNQALVIPDSVITIGKQAFYNFNGSSITIGNGVETIGYQAFTNYVGTNQNLVIPNSVKDIDLMAFYRFAGTSLTLGNNLERIGEGSFYAYNGLNADLVIPNSTITIERDAFLNYQGNTLTIGNNTKTIGGGSFSRFNGSSLTLGNNVQTIGDMAFQSYVGTGTNLIIPDSVKTIQASAFNKYNGPLLTLGNNVETILNRAFASYVGTSTILYIPNNVTNIGENAFSSFAGNELKFCTPLTSGAGHKLESIANGAFSSYAGTWKNLEIPENVITIGPSAFSNFVGSVVTFGDKVESIGDNAFYNYQGNGMLLKFPDTIKTIGQHAFYRFKGNGLWLGANVESIGWNAFYGFTFDINTNRTEAEWNAAISSGDLVLEESWKNPSATLFFK